MSKTIFITGGCGFIGSSLVKFYIKKKFKVINIDSLTYAGNKKRIQSIEKNKNYKFYKIDINNRNKITKLFYKYKPDCIFNLAAESHVDYSIDSPYLFIKSNILGTYNLLESARDYFVSIDKFSKRKFRFIQVSTDEVYGSILNKKKFTEESSYQPSSPYSASKASSDHLVKSWFKTYNLPTIVTNCSNNFGPFQSHEKFIPLIIINALNEKTIPIYGNGSQIRDWIFVKDHIVALDKIFKKGKLGESYNIGSNNEITNLNVTKLICNILDRKFKRTKINSYKNLITFVKDRPGHDKRYAINSNKVSTKLGWSSNNNFKSSINDTVNWYIENHFWWSVLIKNKKKVKWMTKL